MRIVIYEAGQPPRVVEGATVLVENHQGTPIMVACQHGLAPEATYTVAHAAESTFNRVLATLGLAPPVQCDVLPAPAIPHGALPYSP